MFPFDLIHHTVYIVFYSHMMARTSSCSSITSSSQHPFESLPSHMVYVIGTSMGWLRTPAWVKFV